jgi:hypothetical protein
MENMDRTQELEEQVRQLTQAVETMRDQMARLESRGSANGAEPNRSSRRGFLRLGVGAALGALGVAATKVLPAAAADGAAVVTGATVVGEHPTIIQGDAVTAVPVFAAEAPSTTWNPPTTGTFAGPLQGHGASGDFEGVDGWAGGASGWGVYGLTDMGTGVVGESSTGIGLYARGSGRIRQQGLGTAGLPGYTPNLFEQVRDSNGVLWIHNSTGVWRRVNTLRVDAASGSGAAYKPFRRLDTRSGARKAAPSTTVIPIVSTGTGDSAIPADAVGVVGNLTAVGYTGGGFLTISPAGITVGTSSLNFPTSGPAIANSYICGLNGGALQVVVAGHSTHFLLDITGYVQ